MSGTFVDWILFGPAKLVALWPYSGLIIAVILLLAEAGFTLRAGQGFGSQFFRRAPVLAGLLWLIFELYERQVQAVKPAADAVGGLAAFRMDLLVLTPILYVLTLAALISIFNRIGRKP